MCISEASGTDTAEERDTVSTYTVGDDMTIHLQNHLKAAEDREQCTKKSLSGEGRRITRSRSVNLQWNPSMGDKDVIIKM